MIYDDVGCHFQMGNIVARVEISTASRDCFKIQVQQTSIVLVTEHLVHSFVFDGSMVQAVTVGAISHESFGTYLFLCPEIEQQQKKIYKTLSELCPSLSLTWKVRLCVICFQENKTPTVL